VNGAVDRAVLELGRQLLAWRQAGETDWRREGTQYKAEADSRAHEFLADALRSIEPGTPVISEEDPESLILSRPSRYWLIDPIDGTASFVGGYSGFVTQLAVMDEGGPVEGWVYAPATDELFVAGRGRGATLNGRALRTVPGALSGALVDNYPEPRGVAREAKMALGLRHYVESGSLGLKICRVADGTADVFVKDVTVADWDLAAGHLVLSESGGCLTDVLGGEIPYVGSYQRNGIAAAAIGELHEQLIAWYASSSPLKQGENQ